MMTKTIGKVRLLNGQRVIVHEEYIDKVDGIESDGDLYRNLMRQHYVYAKQLLGKYLENHVRDRFKAWLREDFGATFDQANQCFKCLEAWDKQHIQKVEVSGGTVLRFKETREVCLYV